MAACREFTGEFEAAAQPWHGRGHAQVPADFMLGLPPHSFFAQAEQFPNGPLPSRSGSTGTPSATNSRAFRRINSRWSSERVESNGS